MRCEWLREIERRERLACRKKRRAKRGLQMVASLPSPYCFSQRLSNAGRGRYLCVFDWASYYPAQGIILRQIEIVRSISILGSLGCSLATMCRGGGARQCALTLSSLSTPILTQNSKLIIIFQTHKQRYFKTETG